MIAPAGRSRDHKCEQGLSNAAAQHRASHSAKLNGASRLCNGKRLLRRAPRLLNHLLEHLAQSVRRAHTLRERKAHCSTLPLQLQTPAAATRTAPSPVVSTADRAAKN